MILVGIIGSKSSKVDNATMVVITVPNEPIAPEKFISLYFIALVILLAIFHHFLFFSKSKAPESGAFFD